MLFLNIILLLIGFVALIKGADVFVDGSSALAKNFKVPSVIIGLTIVAMGTSAPELAVSTSAALAGSNEIALSNVVGSNIFNTLVVLGVVACIHAVPVDKTILKRDFPVCITMTAALFLLVTKANVDFCSDMAAKAGMVDRITGIILIAVFVIYIVVLIVDAKKNPTEGDKIASKSVPMSFICIILGLIFIVLGGNVVVNSAKEIARMMGMTETLIGLTIIAIGTSLPELVTSIVAAKKGEVELAVGNVVGSNIFNLLLILGVSSTVHPIAVNFASIYDMIILLVISIITYVFCLTGKKVNRIEGFLLVLMYVADMVFAIVR